MKVSIAMLLALLIPALTPAIGQDQAVSPDVSKPEKKICRANLSTGSRMAAGRTCHTQAQWAEIDARTSQDARVIMQGARNAANPN